MTKRLYLKIVKKSEVKFIIETISVDKVTYYNLPKDKNEMISHMALTSNKTIQNTIKSIEPLDGYRNVKVKFSDELKEIYLDEDGNLAFEKRILEEIDTTSIMNRSENEI